VINKEISIILPIYNEKESLPIMVRLLESSIKFKKEIIIVHDTENDTALEIANELVNEFDDVHVVQNKISKGVKYAIETGVSKAKYDTFIILAVDEIFPIIAIDKMLDLMINKNLDFISGTRYAKGGIRLGGSLIGSLFSTIANKVFKFLTKIPFSDCTTGIKMMKKNVWKSVRLESKPIGWAFSFELSIKVYLQEFKIDEYPLKSVDRLFGGSSTFKFGPWLKEYFKWFIWGIKKIKYEK
jgi:dolichol-phosphate mannosyltransferase